MVVTVNAAPFRELSPHQIVPRLADEGRSLGSESTIYRILRAEQLLAHRGRAKAPVRQALRAHVATGPNQVWSWDITYLPTPVHGLFHHLYLMMDVWSRDTVGWDVHDVETAAHAAALFVRSCRVQGADPTALVRHADNGGPMKGATMVATLERLGVLASFSRPSVRNDNPFSESLFGTLKYRPEYPGTPFADRAAARTWVSTFARWYRTQHLHSAIRFVTPADRHAGRDGAILVARHVVYQQARAARPATPTRVAERRCGARDGRGGHRFVLASRRWLVNANRHDESARHRRTDDGGLAPRSGRHAAASLGSRESPGGSARAGLGCTEFSRLNFPRPFSADIATSPSRSAPP